VGRPYFSKLPGLWLIGLALMALLFGPESGWCETLKVGMPNQVLYPDPDFTSKPLGPVPLGSEVSRLLTTGDWFKVDYRDKKGWMNRLAFPGLKTPPGSMPGLLTGGGVKASGRDEVALAGKAERMPTQGPPQMEDHRQVLKRDQLLYRDPDPAETPLGSVPAGAKVRVVTEAGDWCKIRYESKVGWLPREALKF
jgi:hypothetical protein